VLLSVGAIVAGSSFELLSAHRVKGQRDPIGHTAFVSSPTSAADLPVQIYETGLSVACFRLTNTSPANVNVTAIGLELPGELSGFALVSPLDRGWEIQENVTSPPGFPDVTLDFAVIAGRHFAGGHRRLGIEPGTAPATVCVSGPFDPAMSIETMLNGVFVAFRGPRGARDVGVWERR
jgi:hypothetical protein